MLTMQFMNEIPTQYLVFLGGLAMVCGYAIDWALERSGFGIFVNVAVFLAGAFAAFVVAEHAGYYFWRDGLRVIIAGIAGGAVLFTLLAAAKNKILP